jgi:hypothetical protein
MESTKVNEKIIIFFAVVTVVITTGLGLFRKNSRMHIGHTHKPCCYLFEKPLHVHTAHTPLTRLLRSFLASFDIWKENFPGKDVYKGVRYRDVESQKMRANIEGFSVFIVSILSHICICGCMQVNALYNSKM